MASNGVYEGVMRIIPAGLPQQRDFGHCPVCSVAVMGVNVSPETETLTEMDGTETIIACKGSIELEPCGHLVQMLEVEPRRYGDQ